jgi:hypothetical protein
MLSFLVTIFREIYFRSHSSQLVAPPVKLFRSLGDLVRMYYSSGYHCIRYRRWLHPCTRWKLGIRSGHNHTTSLALALRLLALSKGEPEEHGMLLSALWNGSSWGFHDNWRHFCCGPTCYRCLQRGTIGSAFSCADNSALPKNGTTTLCRLYKLLLM